MKGVHGKRFIKRGEEGDSGRRCKGKGERGREEVGKRFKGKGEEREEEA